MKSVRRPARLAALLTSASLLCIRLAPAQPLTVTTLAGSEGPGIEDGLPARAGFYLPQHLAVDPAGRLVVSSDGTLRVITPGGEVATLAGMHSEEALIDGTGAAARFREAGGVAVDAAGNVYVSDPRGCVIRRATPQGVVTTIAGVDGDCRSVDGPAPGGRLNGPRGLVADAAGNLYVADSLSFTIRRLTPAGDLSTVAGMSGVPGSADGPGAAARFAGPFGLTLDAAGFVIISDDRNCNLRRMSPAGVVTTLAGTAGRCSVTDGIGGAASFARPGGVALHPSGDIVVVEGADTVRRVTPAGAVTTIAGRAYEHGYADGPGPSARFSDPVGVAVDAAGDVFVADQRNHVIRRLDAAANVTTYAGRPGVDATVDGTGSAARFYVPYAIAWPGSGDFLVTDFFDSVVRKVTPSGVVTTVAGDPDRYGWQDGVGQGALFDSPLGTAFDSLGNLVVADSESDVIRKVSPAGVVTTIAGSAYQEGSADGNGSQARFDRPSGIAVDAADNVYVADTRNATIRKITPAGDVTTLAGLAGMTGTADGTGAAARFDWPSYLACDAAGNVFVGEADTAVVREVTPAGVVTTLAGLPGIYGAVDGRGAAARLHYISGLAVEPSGDLLVSDFGSGTMRRITPLGDVTTVAGTPYRYRNAPGTGPFAGLGDGAGIALAGGQTYVTDVWRGAVLLGSPGLDDAAVIDQTSGPVGVPRQLDALPRTATAWQWTLVRRPAWSTAVLSDPAIANPTFTPDAADRYVFRLTATAPGGTSITEVTLDAGCPIAITQEPADVTVCEGASFSLTVAASGAPPLAYQWFIWGTAIPGATGPTLTVDPAALDRTYSCLVTNGCGMARSAVAVVSVVEIPDELRQPLYLVKRLPDLVFRWSDVTAASTYTVYEDLQPSGPFATPTGSAPSGSPGLAVPFPGGALKFYRVAGANGCGEGPR